MTDETKNGPDKPEEYKEIFEANIPDLDFADIPDLPLEDFEPDVEADEDEIENTVKGALTYAFIGAGQGG